MPDSSTLAVKSETRDAGWRSAQHIPALDGLRGIAILMVIFCHFVAYGMVNPGRLLLLLAGVGGTGVDLFFVLSGFLITRILLSQRGKPDFLKNFYARRILRIFPLYYGFLFFLYLLVPVLRLGEWTPFSFQVWNWTYTENIWATFFPGEAHNVWQWTPHFWSLCVEEHFYMVWPFLVKSVSPRRLLPLAACSLPFALLSRGIVLGTGHGPGYLTPCRIDALGLGALLAILTENGCDFSKLRRWSGRVFLVLTPVLCIMAFFLSGSGLAVLQLFKNTAIALVYFVCLMSILELPQGNFLKKVFEHPILTTMGKYSYGMYVYHLTIIGLLLTPYVKQSVPVPIRFCMVLGTVVVVAALSWNVFEQRFLRLKDHFTYLQTTRKPAV